MKDHGVYIDGEYFRTCDEADATHVIKDVNQQISDNQGNTIYKDEYLVCIAQRHLGL